MPIQERYKYIIIKKLEKMDFDNNLYITSLLPNFIIIDS
jgi:hypothetical protein